MGKLTADEGERLIQHPRLTRGSLREPLNPRISAVRYAIELDGLQGFDVASPEFLALLTRTENDSGLNAGLRTEAH